MTHLLMNYSFKLLIFQSKNSRLRNINIKVMRHKLTKRKKKKNKTKQRKKILVVVLVHEEVEPIVKIS